jgi:cell division protein FtsL
MTTPEHESKESVINSDCELQQSDESAVGHDDQPSSSTGESREIVWMLLVPAFLVIISALGVIYSSFKARHLVAEFQQLQDGRNRYQEEWGQLLLEQSTLGAFNRVEQIADKELNMAVPSSDKTVMVDL